MGEGTDLAVRFDSGRSTDGSSGFRFVGLTEVLRAEHPAEVPDLLARVDAAAAAGRHCAGFVSYEAAAGLAPELRVHDPALEAPPLALFGIFREREPVELPRAPAGAAWHLGDWSASVTRTGYAAAVEQIRARIAAGETYQVNHTLHLRARFDGCVDALYADLCRSQAASYCASVRFGKHSIVSASPELFFRRAEDRLALRPMKGTRRRGRWREEDAALAEELRTSPKDRAENLMIVDLLRNDAGRVAEWGSVRVSGLWELEHYPTVHQLTSGIEAVTRSSVTLVDLFRALFPCGSVTGAPKIQTMKVIRELEHSPRGVYTGAIGFVSPGLAEFSVAIRTLVIDHRTGLAELGVGSGITWDSVAALEYDECLAKAAFVRSPPEFELLETMRAEEGEVFLLEEHLARLLWSAEVHGFEAPMTEVRRRIHEAAAVSRGSRPHRLRLILDRDGRCRIGVAPLPPCAEGSVAPLRVAVSADPVDSSDPMLYHKTTDRSRYDERRAARPDCDDVLLVNERGELTEATLANLVLEKDGTLWTPPVSAGLLPGTFRERLLRDGRVRERSLLPAELAQADAVYLVNSVRRSRPAHVVA